MNKIYSSLLAALVLLAAIIAGIQLEKSKPLPTFGATANNTPGFVASSSQWTLGPSEGQNNPLGIIRSGYSATSSPACSALIVSTKAFPITLSFATTSLYVSSSTALSSVASNDRGILQGASTTVAYDGSTYGCSRVWAASVGATSTANPVTVIDVRQ